MVAPLSIQLPSNTLNKHLTLLSIAASLLTGCANDITYHFEDPKTCIETRGNQTNSGGSCTPDEAKVNRAYLFKQCKDSGGTPALRKIGTEGLFTVIMGIDCLMPDGEIKDVYGEKFEKDTGQKLSQ